jgi:hypothetical protein
LPLLPSAPAWDWDVVDLRVQMSFPQDPFDIGILIGGKLVFPHLKA